VQSFASAQRFVSSRVLATRQGTVLLGLGAALLAGLVLLVYLNRYRDSVSASSEPVNVVVARKLIEKGTLGDTVARTQAFEVGDIPRDHVQEGALTDPSALRGRVAATDILPGQQITDASFIPASYAGGVGASLVKTERVISVPIDAAHGLVGRVQAGDHVDVYANLDLNGRAVVKSIMQDVYVLETPTGSQGGIGGSGGSTIVVRVTPTQAGKLAFASDEGKLWFVLRPRDGAKPVKPRLFTTESVLGG
jgi:pilus assembly protein CpaB